MNTALYQTLHRRARKLFYSRKDIAMLVSGSLDADAVRRNERAWGLDVARRAAAWWTGDRSGVGHYRGIYRSGPAIWAAEFTQQATDLWWVRLRF
jgi:hypothetical protein